MRHAATDAAPRADVAIAAVTHNSPPSRRPRGGFLPGALRAFRGDASAALLVCYAVLSASTACVLVALAARCPFACACCEHALAAPLI